MKYKPLVSILCITYNQKKYVNECVDSFLSQKTNFEFEILINVDASTDGTLEILQEYKKKYPDIFTIVSHKENQYRKGVRGMAIKFLLPKAKGKYVALCEGDDYWTDPNKLQIQVDYMQKCPDCAICFHPVKVIWENGSHPDSIYPKQTTGFDLATLLERNFIQTNSVMYCRKNLPKTMPDIMPGDWYLHIYNAQFGKIGFINKVMAVYNRNPDGIWNSDDKEKFWSKHAKLHTNFFTIIRQLMTGNKKLVKIIDETINNHFRIIINDTPATSRALEDAIIGNEHIVANTMRNTMQNLIECGEMIFEKNMQLSEKDRLIAGKERQLLEKDQRIQSLLNSKSYKIGRIITKPARVIKGALKKEKNEK